MKKDKIIECSCIAGAIITLALYIMAYMVLYGQYII